MGRNVEINGPQNSPITVRVPSERYDKVVYLMDKVIRSFNNCRGLFREDFLFEGPWMKAVSRQFLGGIKVISTHPFPRNIRIRIFF